MKFSHIAKLLSSSEKPAMPYPTEIISTITEKHKLSSIQQQQLHDALLVEELRSIVEAGSFNPENLLIHLLTASGEPYISVLSPIVAKQIVADPTSLEMMTKVAKENQAAFNEWDSIKVEITRLNSLPASKLREKKEGAEALSARIEVIFDFVSSNPLLYKEHINIAKILFQYVNILVKSIHKAATLYFKSVFESQGREIPADGISFNTKNSGVQLGTVMTIVYRLKDSESVHRIRYFIKTHQNGSTSHVGSAKPPDPKELFIYKVLEYMGYGPKTHFFFNPVSPGGFYIATQDIGFTKVPGKPKSFVLFEEKKEACKSAIENPEYDSTRKAIITFDILSRIFGLLDVTTNPTNFGRIEVTGQGEKWKMLDFRVPDRPDFYLNEKIFKGFEEGNGLYNYEYADFMRDIFRNAAKNSRRTLMADEVMRDLYSGKPCQSKEKGRKMSLADASDRSLSEIGTYIHVHHTQMGIDLERAETDLKQYHEAVRLNLATLSAGIARKHTELIASVDGYLNPL